MLEKGQACFQDASGLLLRDAVVVLLCRKNDGERKAASHEEAVSEDCTKVEARRISLEHYTRRTRSCEE